MNIYNEHTELDLTKLSLGNPGRLQGGSYFSKINYNNKPLYLQTSKCDTKNGIITTGKKIYCDLMFTNNNNNSFLERLEKIEDRIKELLLEKSDVWFNDQLDLEDIEYFFNSPVRTYKTNYYLLRTYVNQKVSSLNVYDENQALRTTDDVKNNIICVINLKGIKFTSQSVHLDIDLKQVMILDSYEDKINFNECLIQTNKRIENVIPTNEVVINKKESLGESNQPQIVNEEDLGSIKLNDDENVNAIEEIESLDEIELTERKTDNIELHNDNNDSSKENENIEVEVKEVINKDVVEDSVANNTLENIENKITENNEEIETPPISLENIQNTPKNTYNLEEITLDVDETEPIQLKKPNEVYYEIYRIAREKAKQAKQAAIIAYLEAKNIKNTYMLEIDSESESDDDSLDDLENLSLSDHELEEKN